jgi:hypothetical protein
VRARGIERGHLIVAGANEEDDAAIDDLAIAVFARDAQRNGRRFVLGRLVRLAAGSQSPAARPKIGELIAPPTMTPTDAGNAACTAVIVRLRNAVDPNLLG